MCVLAYNEEKFLPNLLNDFIAQEYPHAFIEVVLVDSLSSDKTKRIMEDFKRGGHGFYSIQVLDNPGRIQSSGWNVAIQNASGDVISRIDAHAMLPSDFSVKVMQNIAQGEKVVGGIRSCIMLNDTDWSKTLLQVENSLFGSSINSSKRSNRKAYVKTMFHASYCREVFEKAGLFNENLLRTEDNEMHYRIRKNGFRLCYDPQIISFQYARSSLKGMIKQKYANGYWVGVTLGVCPRCISVYHFAPAVFVMGALGTGILALLALYLPAVLLWTLYGTFACASTAMSILKEGFNKFSLSMPALFLLLHCAYGIGTIVGLISLPSKRQELTRKPILTLDQKGKEYESLLCESTL